MTHAMDVLIVEDEMLLAMDLEAMVEDGGHHVMGEAASLEDVEALPAGTAPHLALVDLHLARGSNGFDVCKLVQRRWPDAMIVFVTANASKIPSDFCGAHGVISKPFSNAGILNTLAYLAEGLFDPPPGVPRPAAFTPSPHLRGLWADQ